ncbi:MAG: hypothetical protein LBS05_00150 [Tannerellaceae bacterium]|jgi:hypothetical protein|nr:hypothetical protein [Tannerellaceae bacterium]
MAVIIQLRGDTKAHWTEANPVIAEREMVIETDTSLVKIGNGTDSYNALPYRWDSIFYDGSNSVTSLANLPITKHTVRAEIDYNQSISLTSGLTVGRTVQVFVKNTSTSIRTITIPTTGSYTSMSGASVTIAAAAWIEVHITCYAEGLYNIRVGDV